MNRYTTVLQEYVTDGMYDLRQLIDQNGILKLHLVNLDGNEICISFGAYLAYRKLDEGDAMETLSQLSESALPGRSFYMVEESTFVDWYVKQGYGIRDTSTLKHYAVVTIDDVIDVISLDAPLIES